MMAARIIEAFPFVIKPTRESSIGLEVFKTGLLRGRKHVFFFERYRGGLDWNFERPESSRATLVIDARSLACRDPNLRSEKRKELLAHARELLQVARFPEIIFTSNSVRKTAKHRFDFEGMLAACGKEQRIVADVAAVASRQRIEIDASAKLNLDAYGIRPKSLLFGLIGTKDEISIRCLLWPELPS